MISWFIVPLTIYIYTTSPSEIRVICTNWTLSTGGTTKRIHSHGCRPSAAEVLGIAWQQIAFMAHDADHYGSSASMARFQKRRRLIFFCDDIWVDMIYML